MSDGGDRRIAAIFGVLGAALLVLEGFIDLLRGVVYLAIGRGFGAFGPFDQAVILVVMGLVVGLFALLGRYRSEGRSLVAGVVLIVIAIVGWLGLGFGSGILGLLGTVFVLVSGVVYLVADR
jgi:hypothetical protein